MQNTSLVLFSFQCSKKINESNFMFIDFKYGRNLDVFNLIKALGTHGLLGACSWFQQKKKKVLPE